MPIQTRCPACAAAVPTNATWCSLCHTDLRPRRETTRAAATIVPGQPAAVRPPTDPTPAAPASAAPEASATVPEGDLLTDTSLEDLEPEPRGRHSVGAVPAAVPVPDVPRGRHASGGRRSRASTTYAELAELPVGGDVSPDHVDEVADAMLSRLAMTEPRSRLLDPDDLPGGRWGLAAGGLVAISAVLLVLYSLLGIVFSR